MRATRHTRALALGIVCGRKLVSLEPAGGNTLVFHLVDHLDQNKDSNGTGITFECVSRISRAPSAMGPRIQDRHQGVLPTYVCPPGIVQIAGPRQQDSNS